VRALVELFGGPLCGQTLTFHEAPDRILFTDVAPSRADHAYRVVVLPGHRIGVHEPLLERCNELFGDDNDADPLAPVPSGL